MCLYEVKTTVLTRQRVCAVIEVMSRRVCTSSVTCYDFVLGIGIEGGPHLILRRVEQYVRSLSSASKSYVLCSSPR